MSQQRKRLIYFLKCLFTIMPKELLLKMLWIINISYQLKT